MGTWGYKKNEDGAVVKIGSEVKAPVVEEKKAEKVEASVAQEVVRPNLAEKADPVVIVSDNDAYIHERMKGMPQTLSDVDIKISNLQTETRNPLELPKQLHKYEDRYSFCWVSKNKRSLDDYLDVLGFAFVNKRYFPELPSYLFTANGSIERGDLILLFISRAKAEALRTRPSILSQERVKSTLVKPLDQNWGETGEQYYKPDSGVSESDEDEAPRGKSVQLD